MKTRFVTLIFAGCLLFGISYAEDLSDLAWISGYWGNAKNNSTTEELWTSASGGMILGLHRDVSPDGRASFEYLRMVETPEGIVYMASPNGGSATSFTLIEAAKDKAVFENLEHDFPQRIIYSLTGNKLTARIEDETGERSIEWTWTKMNFD